MIRLIQWLCAGRHCIVAVAYNPEHRTHDDAIAELEGFVASVKVLPQCALCGSKALFYDDQPTKFETMESAQAYLLATQMANLRTQEYLKASKN
jgi:hypothetical protein